MCYSFMVVFGVGVVVLASGVGVELVVMTFGWYFDPDTQTVKQNANFNGTMQSKPKFSGPAPFLQQQDNN